MIWYSEKLSEGNVENYPLQNKMHYCIILGYVMDDMYGVYECLSV